MLRSAGTNAHMLVQSPRMLVQRRAIGELFGQGTEALTTPSGSAGLPESLKAGVEAMSGLAMDHVRVHRDSPQPARIGALAYAQGSDIHLGPGQEEHLPHEAWHIVQQQQGRAAPTTQVAGMRVNDDATLEREADVMGMQAAQRKPAPGGTTQVAPAAIREPVLQGQWIWLDDPGCWEEDDEGYIYDPETAEWKFGDEQEDDYVAGQHDAFVLSLLEAMDSDEVVEYFDNHPDAGVALDYINASPESDDIVDLGDAEDVFDYEDPLAHIAEMPGAGGLIAAVTDSANDHFVASGGAGPCVIVFLRIVTTAGKNLLGSVHLSADEMGTVGIAVASLQTLYREVSGLIDDASNDGVQTATAYAVGGMESNDIDDLMDMVRLRLAFKELAGTMALAGTVMPASDEDGHYVDASMDADGVSYSVQRQRGPSAGDGPVQRVVVDGDMQLDAEQAWLELLPLIEDRRIPDEHHPSMKTDLAGIPADASYDTFDDIVDELEQNLCERESLDYPWADLDEADKVDVSGGSGGKFWTFMKYLTYMLMIFHVMRNVTGASASPLDIEVTDLPDDDCDVMPHQPGELTCETGMEYFCGPDAMDNPVYSDLVGNVRNESGPGVTIHQKPGQGACRFQPMHPLIQAGDVSCDPEHSSPQDLPKVAHELEHGLDHFSGTLHSRTPAPDWITSELNALTRQAAVARAEAKLGRVVTAPDGLLMNDYEAGCPSGGRLYDMLRSYTFQYLKVWVEPAKIEAQWKSQVDAALTRYRQWTADPP